MNPIRIFLTISVIAHLAVLGWGTFSSSPEYSVQKAPSSLEVTLVKIDPKEKQIKKKEEVITAQKPREELPEVPQEEERIEEKKGVEPTPPVKGAVFEAKPDSYQNEAPLYPRLAKQRGWEGEVIVKVHVDTQGRPIKVLIETSSGYRVLDKAAVNAVKKWKFLPAHVGGVPIPSWVQIPVKFVLEEMES